jgi:hypothetical protein
MRATSGTWLHAQLTVLVAACWATGCGGTTSKADDSSSSGGAATGGLICDGSSPKLTDGWHTQPALDYVALVLDFTTESRVEQESGTRCAGASSKPDCETAFAALVPTATWDRSYQLTLYEYFVYTRGDDVGTIGSMAELGAVFGRIDTPNEAAVWLYALNRAVQCDKLEALPDGYLGHAQQELSNCPITYQPLDIKVLPDGTVTETKIGQPVTTNVCSGRRPDGLQLALGGRARSDNQLGQAFAQMAELELASIAAFATLERQLAAHGAPEQLLQRCRNARTDEIAHARLVARLARRFGGQPKSVRVVPHSLPSLSQLALENAREGCVRELYGAAIATWQSAHARDPQIREVFNHRSRRSAARGAGARSGALARPTPLRDGTSRGRSRTTACARRAPYRAVAGIGCGNTKRGRPA